MRYFSLIMVLAGFAMGVLRAEEVESGKWSYAYEVASPKTKSETVLGTLSYDGKELPKVYRRVIVPLGEFVYIDGRGLGSDQPIKWVPRGMVDFGVADYARTARDVKLMLDKNNPGFHSSLPERASSAGNA